MKLKQLLETVVAVDHTTVEVVQVRRRKTAAFQPDQRTQVWRENWDHVQNQPLWVVSRIANGLDDLQALGDSLTLGLACGFLHLSTKLSRDQVDIHIVQKDFDGLSAHARSEGVSILVHGLDITSLSDDLALLEGSQSWVGHDIGHAVEHFLKVFERDVEKVSDT